jgi:subtilisin family serine protease
MKKTALLFLIVLSFNFVFSQTPVNYWIQFKDKANSPYSISNPSKFLSERAIQKRTRFQLPITESDLPVNAQYIKQILALDPTVVLHSQSKWLNGITIYCEDDQFSEKLAKMDFVAHYEITRRLEEPIVYTASPYYHSYGNYFAKPSQTLPVVDLNYGKSEAQTTINNAHWLHRLGFRGEGMLMMVLDGGFHNVDSIQHFKVLRDEHRILGIRNYVKPDADPMREGSHGTMVLSCIASDIAGELVGTAPQVSVYLAQSEDTHGENKIEEDNWVVALEWADSLGCDVINSSLGYTRFDDSTMSYTRASLNGKTSRASIAAGMAAERGIIVCNSAGNEGDNIWHYIGTPADAQNIITIGAIDYKGNRAAFSSYGYSADGRIKPDAAAVGVMARVATPKGKTSGSFGTSFSSPIMSGMVTCLWQAFPDKSAFDIIHAIQHSGNQASRPDSSLGYGITDMFKAYNLLLSPSTTFDASGKELITISLDHYVYSGKPLLLTVNATEKTILNIELFPYQTQNSAKPLTVKVKKGIQTIKLKKFPKKRSGKYDFATLLITGEGINYRYTIGIE